MLSSCLTIQLQRHPTPRVCTDHSLLIYSLSVLLLKFHTFQHSYYELDSPKYSIHSLSSIIQSLTLDDFSQSFQLFQRRLRASVQITLIIRCGFSLRRPTNLYAYLVPANSNSHDCVLRLDQEKSRVQAPADGLFNSFRWAVSLIIFKKTIHNGRVVLSIATQSSSMIGETHRKLSSYLGLIGFKSTFFRKVLFDPRILSTR